MWQRWRLVNAAPSRFLDLTITMIGDDTPTGCQIALLAKDGRVPAGHAAHDYPRHACWRGPVRVPPFGSGSVSTQFVIPVARTSH